MTQEMINALIFVGFVGFVLLAVFVARKFNWNKKDSDVAKLVSTLIANLTVSIIKNTDIKLPFDIKLAVESIIKVVDTIDTYETLTTGEDRFKLILNNATIECSKYGIVVDEDIRKSLEDIIIFLINSGAIEL